MPNIKLESNDGVIFDVDIKVACCSKTIENMLQLQEGAGSMEDEEPVPLQNVSGDILRRVLEWATHHKDDPTPSEDDIKEKRTDDLSSWDQDFLKVDQDILLHLILAANYLDIKSLLDATCKTLANTIKAKKTVEEIRQQFNIRNNLTAAEEEQIREENEFLCKLLGCNI